MSKDTAKALGVEEGPKKQAIFYQRSKALQNEFMLINFVTVREMVRGKLEKVVTAVKTLSRPLDDAASIEIFDLIHAIREATYDLIDSVAIWQQGFTKNIRPQLLNIDYLVDMAASLEFISTCNLRKLWRFQLNAGNFLLLPLPTVGRTQQPRPVTPELRAAVMRFANPTEHRLVTCYTQLLNCMSPEDFKKLLPIQQWMKERWVPNIEKEVKILLKMDPKSRLLRGEITLGQYEMLRGKSTTTSVAKETKKTDDAAAVTEVPDAQLDALALYKLQREYDLNVERASSSLMRYGSPPPIGSAVASGPLVHLPLPVDRSSPIRPPRVSRAELARQAQQEAAAKAAAELAKAAEEEAEAEAAASAAAASDDLFSDDSEDEEIRMRSDGRGKQRDEKQRLLRAKARERAEEEERKRAEEEAARTEWERREKKRMDESRAIEDKAKRSSVKTSTLRETWIAKEGPG